VAVPKAVVLEQVVRVVKVVDREARAKTAIKVRKFTMDSLLL
jgi:hypothetical protein